MVQPHQVDAEPAQAFGDARGVLGGGKVRAEREINAIEAHSRAIAGTAEVITADDEPVFGRKRVIEEA